MDPRHIFTALLVSGLLLTSLGGGATTSASAKSHCSAITIHVSKRLVKRGKAVRVHGVACRKRGTAFQGVRIRMSSAGHSGVVGTARTHRAGRYSMKVRIGNRTGRLATLQTLTTNRRSGARKLRVVDVKSTSTGSTDATSAKPDPASSAGSSCALGRPDAELDLVETGCRLLASDTASNPDPTSFWGRVDCGVWPELDPSRQQVVTTGGDTHPTATGAADGNNSFRRMSVLDGDDVAGERCELGENDHNVGPTAFYHEGQRRATYMSIRLPDNLDSQTPEWQTVMQMKQAQPANNGGGSPVLEMGATGGVWQISGDNGIDWTFPSTKNQWTRFIFDVNYSQNPNKGWLQVSADLDGNGSIGESERSPRIAAQTLKPEIAGAQNSGIAPGASIPSHLRTGVYHNAKISCPPPAGCSSEVDNVQVLAPQ